MEIAGLTVAQHADYLALVNAEIRPEGAATRAEEDFPLALGAGNLAWQLAATGPDGRPVAGLAMLVRPFATSCGIVRVGIIGSVATSPPWRGRGLSTRLQAVALGRLRDAGVPLAALWTDRPEIYAGRGFRPAGWEWHADLEAACLPPLPAGVEVRGYEPADAGVVSVLHEAHPWRTLREPGDAERLYGMPGTRGLLAVVDGQVAAAVFCGKGADFGDYVPEWDGPPALVAALLGVARARGLAGAVLIPAGGEELADLLRRAGARVAARDGGCWAVLRPELLAAAVNQHGGVAPAAGAPVAEWLGCVEPSGRVRRGPVTLAVWGFDSA